MRPRWRKVLADLWGNKTRFVLVVLSLTTGLFTVGMIAGGYVTILEDMQNGFEAIHPADLRFMTESFDEELIQRVQRMDGVVTADGEKRLQWQFKNGDGEWKDMIVRVLPEDGQHIDQVELLSGSFPEDRQIMLDVHKETGIEIGDTLVGAAPLRDAEGTPDHRDGAGPDHRRAGHELFRRADLWICDFRFLALARRGPEL